ncbi:phosphate ABC transporter substrate-binding protein [bacterium]|nr:phosphate ABC transporter substrate-binding protein [bacterium]
MMKLFKVAVILILTAGFVFASGDQIVLTGSTTVLPIAQACAEAFMDINPKIDVTVRGGGSGVGIAAIIDGTCDIANSSRDIKTKEITTAKGKGVNPTDHIVAWDGIAIVIHPNLTIKGITIERLRDIYTGKISNWKALGGPNKNIIVVSRDVSSGTFEVFKEKVLEGGSVRDDALKLASNQAVSTTISTTPFSIGYIGLGYLNNKVKAIQVNGIDATAASAKSGTYPIVRSLHMFTNGEAKGIAKQYIDFVLSSKGQEIVTEMGFISIK